MREYSNNGCVIMLDGSPIVTFDLVEKVSHVSPVTLVEYPVEHGASVAQLGYRETFKLDMTGIVTSYMIDDMDGDNPDRDLNAYSELRSILERLDVVRVVTLTDIYDDMVITELEKVEDETTDGLLLVNITFQRVKFGRIERVDVPIEIISASSGARSGAVSDSDSGNKQGEKEEGDERRSSIARALDAFKIKF